MEIAIITSGYLPVPAAMGGAVESLVENLIKKNEEIGKLDLTIFSTSHQTSVQEAQKFRKTHFIFIKPPAMIRLGDRLIYFAVKHLLKRKKSMSYRYILQRLHYLSQVSRFLQKNNYDKVILENHATLFLTLKKRGNAKKYVGRYYYHLHNEVTNDYGCRAIMLQSRKILGVSRYIDRTLGEFIGEIPNEKLDVLRNAVDLSRFGSLKSKQEAAHLRDKFSISTSDQVILFTGRLNQEKGIKELLEAFKQINQPNAKLVIVGGYFYASGMISPYEKEIEQLADSLGERVIFTGFIDYEKMPALYSMADVAAIPSIWEDPAPLTIIESMASGLPLVTTDSGGIPEYVTNECACVIKRDQLLVDHLAEAFERLLSNQLLRHQMATASRKNAEKMNLDQYYSDFVEEIT